MTQIISAVSVSVPQPYHNIFKLFISVSKFESTSTLCMVTDALCCQAVIRNLVYRFMQRLELAPNDIDRASSLYRDGDHSVNILVAPEQILKQYEKPSPGHISGLNIVKHT